VPSAERAMAPSPDLRINGKPLLGNVSPPVWGFFGPEWTSPTTDQPWRCAMDIGSLKIYSPEPLQAQLLLEFTQEAFDGKLEVTVNDDSPIATERKRRGKEIATVPLRAGWNAIVIELTSPDQVALRVANTADGCQSIGSAGSPLQINEIDILYQN
jgi:hypothetical protein